MSTELAEQTDVQITETSWTPTGPLSFEEWVDRGRALGMMGRACQWWLGDWVNYGDAAYGEKYSQAVDETGLDLQTLMNWAWVAGTIPPQARVGELSWAHHREVAALEPERREHYLTVARESHLPVAKLSALVKADRALPKGAPPVQMHGYVTNLRIDHDHPDQEAADEWAQKLTARLAGQGHRVTYRSTTKA